MKKLGAEEVAAPRIEGQGREGSNDREGAEIAAVVGFQAPEGDQKAGLNPVLSLYLRQQRAMLGQQLAPSLHTFFRHCVGEIAPEG